MTPRLALLLIGVLAGCAPAAGPPTAEAVAPDGRRVARAYTVSLREAAPVRVAVAPAGERFRASGVGGPGPRDVLEARGAAGLGLGWQGADVLVVRVPPGAQVRVLPRGDANVQVRVVRATDDSTPAASARVGG